MYRLGPAEVFGMQRDMVQRPGPNVSAHRVTVVTVGYVNMQSCCIIKARQLLGVSSVPFPFWFPFQLHCKLVSSGISSQSVQNIWFGVLLKTRDLLWSYLFWGSAKTSEMITFNHLRCHSNSTALGTRTGYWTPTQRGTEETPPVPVHMVHKFHMQINYHSTKN